MTPNPAVKRDGAKARRPLPLTLGPRAVATNKIRNLIAAVGDTYFRLHVNQRFYVNSFVLLAAFLAARPLLGDETSKGFLFLFLAFWVIAIAYDLIALYKKIYETVLGKALLVILFSLCANIAIVLSSQVVNDIVGIDPSKFPHTIALLSILTIPFFIAACFGILSMVLLFAIPIFLMVHTLPDEKAKAVFFPGLVPTETIPYPKTTRLIQLVSFAVFCGVVYSSSQKSSKSYETFLTETARSFLYQFEMYPKAPCTVSSGSRIAFLGDGKILVGSKSEAVVTFTIQECKGGA